MASLTKLSLVLLFGVLIFSSFCFLEIHGRRGGGGGGGGGGGEQREFDYFALSLQWPGTVCQRTKHCCPSNGCCRSDNAPMEFTIHGLWPDYNDGTWPACCKRTKFDMKEISSLLPALQKYWPTYSCGSTSSCFSGKGPFWAHEWEKHGTCSSPVVHDEYGYFVTTLNVYFKYNVTSILKEAGYVASNSEKYPLGGIVSAIQNAFGATPQLVCSNGAVQELRLCFYKDFKPRDCLIGSGTLSETLAYKSSCPRYVSLPDRLPSGRGNTDAATPWLEDSEISAM